MFSMRQATGLLWRPVNGVARVPAQTPLPWSIQALRLAPSTRALFSSPRSANAKDASSSASSPQNHQSPSIAESSEAPSESHKHLSFQMPEPKLSLTFTCTVEACHTRSTHQFTRRSYEKGIVIVQCPGCKNRHLIADHLGWFKESTKDGKLKTVEDLVRAKGEKVRRGTLGDGGVVEYTPE